MGDEMLDLTYRLKQRNNSNIGFYSGDPGSNLEFKWKRMPWP
jgi:hypothetical protein